MSDSFPPSTIVAPSTSKHELTVILLNGRGSRASDFRTDFGCTLPSSGNSPIDLFPPIKWVFPCANLRFSTVDKGLVREWYDVYSLRDPDERNDLAVEGLVKSIKHVTRIIEDEHRLLQAQHPDDHPDTRRLVLGGISMGCAVSVHALLASLMSGSPGILGGFFGWCGWMPFTSAMEKQIEKGPSIQQALQRFYRHDLPVIAGEQHAPEEESLASVPVLLSHCKDDSVVDTTLGSNMETTLSQCGMDVKGAEYDVGGHWIKEPDEMDRFVRFMRDVLSSVEASGPPATRRLEGLVLEG